MQLLREGWTSHTLTTALFRRENHKKLPRRLTCDVGAVWCMELSAPTANQKQRAVTRCGAAACRPRHQADVRPCRPGLIRASWSTSRRASAGDADGPWPPLIAVVPGQTAPATQEGRTDAPVDDRRWQPARTMVFCSLALHGVPQ